MVEFLVTIGAFIALVAIALIYGWYKDKEE